MPKAETSAKRRLAPQAHGGALMAKAKAPAKTPAPQPHGGALMVGGVPGNAGGGRPKEVLRHAMREAFTEKKGVRFIAGVMAGEVGEKVVVTTGVGEDARTQVVTLPAKIRDRLYAAELLMDRGYGKPPQELTIEDDPPRRTGEEVMAHILELLPRVLPLLPLNRQEIARLLARRREIEVLVSGKQIKDGRSGSGNGDGS